MGVFTDIFRLTSFCLVAGVLCVRGAVADDTSWNAVQDAATPGTPPKMLVVDKNIQKLRIVDTFDCTTGQKDGIKSATDDLRTPEGIYFVKGKVPGKLNMAEYGGIGYALNYPNPIDRLYGRTGYGIWIHSRGRAITPKETRGCIAVNLDDMGKLLPSLKPGTPIVVAGSVLDAKRNNPDAAVKATRLQKRVDVWHLAWSERADDFFEFYDQAAYEKTQNVKFDTFRRQKMLSFRNPWLHVVHGRVNVLQGPDYWVTWFTQFYKSPTRTFEGVRRLYWIERDGEFYIAGMEWIDGQAEDITVSQRKVVKPAPAKVVVAAAVSQKPAPVPAAAKTDDWKLKTALDAAFDDLKMSGRKKTGKTVGRGADAKAAAGVQAQAMPPKADATRQTPLTPAPPRVAVSGPVPTAATLPLRVTSGKVVTQIGQTAPERTAGDAVKSAASVQTAPKPSVAVAKASAKAGAVRPAVLPEGDLTSKRLTTAVMNFIEYWRKVWEAAELDPYLDCYLEDAVQQRYFGKKAIRNHKRMVWKTKAPSSVRLSNIRVYPQTDGRIIVTMRQDYVDTKGYADSGLKTVELVRSGKRWLIKAETWKKL